MNNETVLRYDLSIEEVAELDALLTDLRKVNYNPGELEVHDQAWAFIPRLPTGLREFVEYFRRDEPAAAFKVGGLPVDDIAVGPTPANWTVAAGSSCTLREELFVTLLGKCLGEVFTWSTLQAGRMIHNVIPIAGEEQEQSGHGSAALLEWHTEDGFHPYRCDYLGLFGIRNHDDICTTLSSIRDVSLSDASQTILSEPRFNILPDNEHLRQLSERKPRHPGLRNMREMRDNPKPVPVLFGAADSPYLRIDPYFMECVDSDDDDAEKALKVLITELDRVQRDVIVESGSLLVIDNYLAVHGRRAFNARYDGTDRWLKKILVTRDLRKSRGARDTAGTRVLV